MSLSKQIEQGMSDAIIACLVGGETSPDSIQTAMLSARADIVSAAKEAVKEANSASGI